MQAGDCHCGNLSGTTGLRVIPIREAHPARMPHCARAGFETIVSIPIRVHGRLMGELDLFYHAQYEVGAAERSHPAPSAAARISAKEIRIRMADRRTIRGPLRFRRLRS